jgi:hypothetical protein
MGVTPGNGLLSDFPADFGRDWLIHTSPDPNLGARGNAGYNQLSALGQALGKVLQLQGGKCSIS